MIEVVVVLIGLQVHDLQCYKSNRSGISTNGKEKKEDLLQQRRQLLTATKYEVIAFNKSAMQVISVYRNAKVLDKTKFHKSLNW